MEISAMIRLLAYRSLGLHAMVTAIQRSSKGILLLSSTSVGFMDLIEAILALHKEASKKTHLCFMFFYFSFYIHGYPVLFQRSELMTASLSLYKGNTSRAPHQNQ